MFLYKDKQNGIPNTTPIKPNTFDRFFLSVHSSPVDKKGASQLILTSPSPTDKRGLSPLGELNLFLVPILTIQITLCFFALK